MDWRDELAMQSGARRRNEDHQNMKIRVYHDPETWVDAKYEVCTGCDGRGKYVNPGIDAGGITGSEMAELGTEFEESYFSGRFDITCQGCDGKRVRLVEIWERVPEEIKDKILAEEEGAMQDAAWERAERMMGA